MAAATARNANHRTSSGSGERKAVTLPTTVISQLLSYLELHDGWHDNAPAPEVTAVARSFEVLQQWHASLASVEATIEIGPALDGGIDMTFDKADDWVSVLCRNDGRVEVERSDGVEEITRAAATADLHMHWLTRKV